MRTSPVVVATDGTEPSRAAVRWAAQEAVRISRPLLITHVIDWDWTDSQYDFGGHHAAAAREFADKTVARATSEAKAAAPAVEVDTDVLVGRPVTELIKASDQSALIVLGNRGRGGFAGLLLGSVSRRVATHAACPVVVVRGSRPPGDGPVAVGVDDSDSAGLVLETAFAAARDSGTSLVAIRSYTPVVPLSQSRVTQPGVSAPVQDDDERAKLTGQLAPWRSKYPELTVEALVSHDTAAAVLTGVSHHARLVVVGSRGHGVIAGTLLGSTGLQLLHHAECPVLIVRPHPERDDRR